VQESRDANAAEKAGGINIAISIGSSESQSNSLSQSNTAGAARHAGGTITIAATGAGPTATSPSRAAT
jgi:filamentous hemagglutinin